MAVSPNKILHLTPCLLVSIVSLVCFIFFLCQPCAFFFTAEENALRSIQNLEERQTNARVQSAQVSSVTEKDIPRIKYALSLYVNVSNIVWDYASDNVKGMITSAVGEPTKMFDIDPSTSSSFDICNELWELMD
jgi:hypothetical protein